MCTATVAPNGAIENAAGARSAVRATALLELVPIEHKRYVGWSACLASAEEIVRRATGNRTGG
jgi:hypothetical protein